MQSLSYWKQFENTGKVEDYLYYSCISPGKMCHVFEECHEFEESKEVFANNCARKVCEETGRIY